MSFRGSILLTSSDNFRGLENLLIQIVSLSGFPNTFPYSLLTQRLLFPGEFGGVLPTEVRYWASFACHWTLSPSKGALHMVMVSKMCSVTLRKLRPTWSRPRAVPEPQGNCKIAQCLYLYFSNTWKRIQSPQQCFLKCSFSSENQLPSQKIASPVLFPNFSNWTPLIPALVYLFHLYLPIPPLFFF